MKKNGHLKRVFLILLAVLILAGLGPGAMVSTTNSTPRPVSNVQTANTTKAVTTYHRPVMSDSVELSAFVIKPCQPGPYPIIVAPSSWSLNALEYLGAAQNFAASGYLFVSYTTRGFWASGGSIQVANSRDVSDAIEMISWAIKNFNGDAKQVGMLGVSYGAGLSLLAASKDPRIKAVSTMSAWSDLSASLLPYETPNSGALALLIPTAQATGRLQGEVKDAMNAWTQNKSVDAIRRLAPERSPINYLDGINANGTAVMIANNWQDQFFAPDQLILYFNKLQVPKRLQIVPGQHATSELLGTLGIPNTTWETSARWFDRYLKGINNGIDREPSVQLVEVSHPTFLTAPTLSAYKSFATWNDVTASKSRLYLNASGSITLPGRTGTMGASAKTGWTWKITGGMPSIADKNLQVSIPLIVRTVGTVFQTDKFAQGITLGGIPKMHLSLSSTRSTATIFVTLYEMPANALALAKPISYQAVTLSGMIVGRTQSVDIELNPLYESLEPGSRAAIVIDSYDANYSTATRLGDTLTFSSPSGDPSYIELPLSS